MFANGTEEIEEFPISPIDCFICSSIAWYMCFLLAATVTVNSFLLLTFLSSKQLRQPINTFVIFITILNLIGSILEFPFVIGANFSCRWIFHHFGCVASAYTMYFVGCTSIYLMAAISIERFYTIYNPMSMKKITYKNSILAVQICLIFGALWPTMPLVGWSHYSLEGGLTSCSVTWHEDSTNVMSYNAAIFLFVYCLPVTTIVGTNIKLLLILKRMPQINKNEQDPKIKKRLEMERRVTYVMIFYIMLFCVTWTPYAIVALWSSFINPGGVSPLTATLPAVIAKSSMLWSPLFFILSNKNAKSRILNENTYISKSADSTGGGSSGVMAKLNQPTAITN